MTSDLSYDLWFSRYRTWKKSLHRSAIIRASSNGSPAIGLTKNACKGEKCANFLEFFGGTFPGGYTAKATRVLNFKCPALVESFGPFKTVYGLASTRNVYKKEDIQFLTESNIHLSFPD
ncbi:hypothetical protein J6590_010293 [Homalodisca vitripennis]|nr:hypothetical protein J6590_010293 [Homalodisca vitripennis]